MKNAALAVIVLLMTGELGFAQTINTSCTLYPTAAYCTSTSNWASVAEAQRQQYETGQAIGSGIGMAIFRAHFPGMAAQALREASRPAVLLRQCSR